MRMTTTKPAYQAPVEKIGLEIRRLAREVETALAQQDTAASECRAAQACILRNMLDDLADVMDALCNVQDFLPTKMRSVLLDERKERKLYLLDDGADPPEPKLYLYDARDTMGGRTVSGNEAMELGFRLPAILRAVAGVCESDVANRRRSARDLFREARRLKAIATLVGMED